MGFLLDLEMVQSFWGKTEQTAFMQLLRQEVDLTVVKP